MQSDGELSHFLLTAGGPTRRDGKVGAHVVQGAGAGAVLVEPVVDEIHHAWVCHRKHLDLSWFLLACFENLLHLSNFAFRRL